MKFPKYIQLGNVRVKIVITKSALVRKRGRKYKHMAGIFDYYPPCITLSGPAPDYDKIHTLWHEIAHYLQREWGGFTCAISMEKSNIDGNEVFCEWFSEQIIQILRDNPKLANLGREA